MAHVVRHGIHRWESLDAGADLELHEIQATVLRPRPEPYFGTHVLLRVDDALAGRDFLRRLTPHVDSAASWWNAAKPWLSVARG
jgi:deferrochelatase/peroxidase EfeB